MKELRANFQEIYHAVYTSKPEHLPLVANYAGTRIYDARFGWGYLWRWFYHFSSWLTGRDAQLDRLKSAILYTHTLFYSTLSNVAAHLDNYQNYLKRSGKGYVTNEEDCQEARKIITEWNRATKPFIKMLYSSPHPRLELLLKYCFEEKPNFSFLHPQAEMQFAYQKIIDLEGITGFPVPLSLFKKVLKGKPLNSIEQNELHKWIGRVNKTVTSSSCLHRALEAFIELSFKKEADSQDLTAILELALEDMGCQVFQLTDEKQIEWARRLNKGSILSLSGEELVLEEEICSKHFESEHMRIFAVKGQSNLVLIAKNKTALPIKSIRNNPENGFGIAPAQLLKIARDGSFALIERLFPLNSQNWRSTCGQVHHEDLPLLNSLIELLDWLVKQNKTPANFSAAWVMFNKNFHLRSLKPTTSRPFDFNALEEFISDCAGGNLTIFQHLMVMSGLAEHSIARFYRDMIFNALNGDATSAEELGGIYKIVDPKVIDRGTEIALEALFWHRQLCIKYHELHPNESGEAIHRQVSKFLVACHQATKAAGRWWPQLFQEVEKMLIEMKPPTLANRAPV